MGPAGPARHGSHAGTRAEWLSALSARLVAPGLAILCVGVLVVVLLVLGGHPGNGSSPATVGSGSSTTQTGFSPPVAPATAGQAPSPSPRPSPTPSRAAPAAARPAVLVLNNSRIYHLARRVAGELEAAGWPVAGVGNLTGRLPATTLFYGPGSAAAARALAARFPEITVIAPRPGWLPGDAALTLVVTRYWT
jgi:hypothetical protein